MLVGLMDPGPGVIKVVHPSFREFEPDTSVEEQCIREYFEGHSVSGGTKIEDLELVRDQSKLCVTAVLIKFSDPSCKYYFPI